MTTTTADTNKAPAARRTIGAALLAVAWTILVGCQGAPGTQPPTPQSPTTPSRPTEYTGSYGATVGRTAINLEVTADAITAVAFTEPSTTQRIVTSPKAASALSANAAAATPEVEVWVILTGDLTVSGSNVTVTITGVERDGQELEDAELSAYTSCTIIATTGDTFDDEVMAGVVKCIGSTGPVMLHRQERPSLFGTWGGQGFGLEISSTRLKHFGYYSTEACPPSPTPPPAPPQRPDPVPPSGSEHGLPEASCGVTSFVEYIFDIEEIGDTTLDVVLQDLRRTPDPDGLASPEVVARARGYRMTLYYVFSSDGRLSLGGSLADPRLWLSKQPEQ